MATVTIKNATVTRIIPNYGFKAAVEVPLKSGDTKKETYTVWTDATVREGDVVSVNGLLSAKVEEFEGRDGKTVRYAAIHVNNAKIETAEANAPF
jgi:FKBP-type peptidyl-prolyl cis-trans isomerase (trigger factor)